MLSATGEAYIQLKKDVLKGHSNNNTTNMFSNGRGVFIVNR